MAQGTRDAWKIVFCPSQSRVRRIERERAFVCCIWDGINIGKRPDWCCCKISSPWLKSWLKSITAAVPEWEWQEWKFPLDKQSHRVSGCYHCGSMWAMWLDALSDYWEVPDKCVICFRWNHNRTRIKPSMIEARVVFTWKRKERFDKFSTFLFFLCIYVLFDKKRITYKARRHIRTSQN